MKRSGIAGLLLLLNAALVWPAAAQTQQTATELSPPQITLTQAVQHSLQLRTQPVVAATAAAQLQAIGYVLDPAPWLLINAKLATAEAIAAASGAEAQRLHRLYSEGRNSSLKALQAAEAQARADRLRRHQMFQTLRLDWGATLAGLSPDQRAQLSQHLVAGDSVLVRADAAGATTDAAPASATLQPLDGGEAIPATVVGPAPGITPELQAPAWLLRIDGSAAQKLRRGQALRVWLQLRGSQRSAVQIPESAIVRIRGKPYAYVQLAPVRFQRRPLTLMSPSGSGWIAETPIKPGDALVVEGAGALWWAEQAPPATAGGKAGAMQGDGDDD